MLGQYLMQAHKDTHGEMMAYAGRWWCTPRSFSHPRSWDLHHVHKQMAATWRCRFNQHRENVANARAGARRRASTPTCAGKHNAPLAYVKRPNALLMHRECLLGTRFLDLPQSVVTHSILICIVVILQNARVCHTSHAVGVSFDASVSFEFISVTDACTHFENMCCDTSPFACTKRGDANSVSLMATHDQPQI